MSVANAYAKALYEAAIEAKSTPQDLDRLANELAALDNMVATSKDLRVVLLGPMASARQKASLVEALCAKMGSPKLFIDFMKLMARKGRLTHLKEVHEAFYTIRLAADGGITGQLISAEPIGEAEVEELAKAFGKKLGKRIAFRVSTDDSLLAGLKVNVNGVTYDGTLRSQLERLRDRLTN